MDKEKVIRLSNRINDVVTSECPTSISWHKIAYASELLQSELNSKTIMPKVWNDWFETYNLPQDMMILELAKLCNGRIRDQLDVNLYNAIVSEDNSLTVWDCLNVIRSECEPSNNWYQEKRIDDIWGVIYIAIIAVAIIAFISMLIFF